MALPSSPSDGQIELLNGAEYVYDASKSRWLVRRSAVEIAAAADLDSDFQNWVNTGIYGNTGFPASTILQFPTTTMPDGFALCDGSTFDEFAYPDLYAALGSNVLPDLRGQMISGWDSDRAANTFETSQGSSTPLGIELSEISYDANTEITNKTGLVPHFLYVNDSEGSQTNVQQNTKPDNYALVFGIALYHGAGVFFDSDLILSLVSEKIGDLNSTFNTRLTALRADQDSDEIKIQSLSTELLAAQLNINALEAAQDSDEVAIQDLRTDLETNYFKKLTGVYNDSEIKVGAIRFTGSDNKGAIVWNDVEDCLDITTGDVTLQVGQEVIAKVRNEEDSDLTDGTVVRIVGATGDTLSVRRASDLDESTSASTFGVMTETIGKHENGFCTLVGKVRGLDTSMFFEGDTLYLGDRGELVNVKPDTPNHLVFVGWVTRVQANNGEIYVKPRNGWEIDELHDVLITPDREDKDILRWNESDGYWTTSHNLTELEATVAQLEADRDSDTLVIQNLREDLEQAVADRVFTDNLLASRLNGHDSDLENRGRFFVQATAPTGYPDSGWVNTTNMRLHVWSITDQVWVEVTLT